MCSKGISGLRASGSPDHRTCSHRVTIHLKLIGNLVIDRLAASVKTHIVVRLRKAVKEELNSSPQTSFI